MYDDFRSSHEDFVFTKSKGFYNHYRPLRPTVWPLPSASIRRMQITYPGSLRQFVEFCVSFQGVHFLNGSGSIVITTPIQYDYVYSLPSDEICCIFFWRDSCTIYVFYLSLLSYFTWTYRFSILVGPGADTTFKSKFRLPLTFRNFPKFRTSLY